MESCINARVVTDDLLDPFLIGWGDAVIDEIG
jgi:hypothetical protein